MSLIKSNMSLIKQQFHTYATRTKQLHTKRILPYLQLKVHLESSQTSVKELFCRNSQHYKTIGYFHTRAALWMFDRVLNATLPNNLLQLEKSLRMEMLTTTGVTHLGLPQPANSLDLHQQQEISYQVDKANKCN